MFEINEESVAGGSHVIPSLPVFSERLTPGGYFDMHMHTYLCRYLFTVYLCQQWAEAGA